MREGKDIFFYLGCCGLSVLGLDLFNSKYFIDWDYYVSKDIVFGNDIRESSISIDDSKLIRILVIPKHFIYPVGYKFEVVVRLGSGEEKVDLSILVLENEFCAIFVAENSENRIIRFVLHDHVFILNVVILKPVSVVQVDQKYFRQKILNHLPVAFNWK